MLDAAAEKWMPRIYFVLAAAAGAQRLPLAGSMTKPAHGKA